MPKMHISKSIVVNKPIGEVFSKLNDFNQWTAWSPWLIQDPKATVNVADDSKSYEWEGPRTGSGNMSIVNEVENKSLDMDLMFLKPWKSKAKVFFETEEVSEGTKVTWKMDSSLPFFMFWMKKQMVAFVGMDYERGLRLLKNYSEEGELQSKLEFKGNENLQETKFIGVKTQCTMDTMGKKMAEDMPKVGQFVQEQGLEVSGAPFTQYHKWDVVNNNIEYTSGIPVKEAPENLPAGFYVGSIPSTPVYTVEHKGPYQFLGNAWSSLYTMQRAKEISVNKKIDPFETYHNKPGEVEQTELITQVHFPLS